MTDPAIDGAERGEGGGFFNGTGRVEGDDAGKDGVAAALSSLDGDRDVLAGEEVNAGGALEAEVYVLSGLGGRGQDGACGGAGAAGRCIEFAGLAAEPLFGTTQLNDAGDAGAGLVELDGVEHEETAGAVVGGRDRIQFGRVVPDIGLQLQGRLVQSQPA